MPSVNRRDVAACAGLFVTSLVVLLNRPHNLPMADEAYYLGIIKRLFEGEVLYRDVFDFLPPLFHWFFVAVYYAFGVSIEAARSAMAVCHALFCVLLYLTCRGIGVRRSFAACAPLAFLALAQPVWPFVSPHWFSTFWMGLLYYLLFARGWVLEDGRALALGLVVGALGCTQHHKGVVVAAGVATVLVLARAFDGTATAGERWRRIRRAVLRLAAGALLVATVCMAVAIARAGVGPVMEALFIMPLRDYASYRKEGSPWAHVYVMTHSMAMYSIPAVLRWSPVVLPAAIVQSLWSRRLPGARMEARSTILQVVFALFWIGAIAYFPDFIHVAFIFPVFLIIGARVLESALPARTAWARYVAPVVAFAVLLGLGRQLYADAARFRREFPLSRQTAFGEVDFASPQDLALLDRVGRVLDESGDRRLFCYPVCSLYLTLDARNPTRHQFLLAAHNPPEHFHEVTEALAANEPPILVFARVPSPLEDYKQLMDFVRRHYDASEPQLPGFDLYVRKAGSSSIRSHPRARS
jgi:hypothetical protein